MLLSLFMTSLLTSLCWCFNAHYCRVTEPELCIFFKISAWPYQKLCLLRPPCLQCWCFCEEQHRRGLSAKVQCLTFQSCLHPRSCQWQLPKSTNIRSCTPNAWRCSRLCSVKDSGWRMHPWGAPLLTAWVVEVNYPSCSCSSRPSGCW